jgi:hypothetical protein
MHINQLKSKVAPFFPAQVKQQLTKYIGKNSINKLHQQITHNPPRTQSRVS